MEGIDFLIENVEEEEAWGKLTAQVDEETGVGCRSTSALTRVISGKTKEETTGEKEAKLSLGLEDFKGEAQGEVSTPEHIEGVESDNLGLNK